MQDNGTLEFRLFSSSLNIFLIVEFELSKRKGFGHQTPSSNGDLPKSGEMIESGLADTGYC